MVRRVPLTATEADLQRILVGFTPVSIRLIRDRSTGESKGYGFIEFNTVSEAESLVILSKGTLKLGDRSLSVDFSHGNRKESSFEQRGQDWNCTAFGCDAFNFARRTACFKCGAPKDPHAPVADEQNSGSPVLVVRGLDPNTSSESIQRVFGAFQGFKEVRLMRERATNQSRGFCFVEFDGVQSASIALKRTTGMRIDNVTVRISYSRDTPNHMPGAKQAKANGKQRPPNISETFEWDNDSGYWFDKTSRFYYDATTQLYYHGDSGIYYRWDVNSGNYIQVDERGVMVQAAPAAQQGQLAAKAKQKKDKEKEKADREEQKRQAKEENSKKKKTKVSHELEKKPIDKQTLIGNIKFSLKGVDKDLNRWKKIKKEQDDAAERSKKQAAIAAARAEAAKAERAAKQKAAAEAATRIKASAAAMVASKASLILESRKAMVAIATGANMSTGTKAEAKPAAVLSNPMRRDKWMDCTRIACLLCQRQFKSLEILQKHVAQSGLHKKNLQIEEFKQMAKEQREQSNLRVSKAHVQQKTKQREEQFEKVVQGVLEEETVRHAKNAVNQPLDNRNRGNQMLRNMGWSEGKGLGRKGQGITAPIQAGLHDQRKGIGASPAGGGGTAMAVATQGNTYKEAARMRQRQRFLGSEAPTGKSSGSSGSASKAYLQMMQQFDNSKCSDDDGSRPLLK